MADSSFRIEWEAHEYEHKERSSDWFWAVGIVAAGLAITAVIFGNIILGILVLIGAFALSLFINRPPRTTSVVVDDKGVTRDRIHYPYSTLKAFWIDTDHSHRKILLRSQKLFMPIIIIPLGEEVDLSDLHDALSHFLTEEHHTLPFVEKVLEYLGF
jgi:hypothetical protein